MSSAHRLLVGTICLIGISLGIGGSFFWRHRGEKFVRLEPTKVELVRQTILEGQKVDVALKLYNGSSEKFVVEGVHASCSCTSITTNDKQSIVPGHEIRPRQILPLTATIDLAGRSGSQRFFLTVRGKLGNRSISRESTIHMLVHSGWSVVPAPIVLNDLEPGKTIERDFLFLDGTPGANVPLPAVSSSLPGVLTAEVVRGQGERKGQLTKIATAERQEHLLRIKIQTPDGMGVHNTGLLTFASDEYPERQFSVPVTFQNRQAAYALSPSVLYLIELSAGEKWTREVDCEIRADQSPHLTILQCPAGINATLKETGRQRKRLELTGVVPMHPQGEIKVVLGGAEKDRGVATLVVHYGLPVDATDQKTPSATP